MTSVPTPLPFDPDRLPLRLGALRTRSAALRPGADPPCRRSHRPRLPAPRARPRLWPGPARAQLRPARPRGGSGGPLSGDADPGPRAGREGREHPLSRRQLLRPRPGPWPFPPGRHGSLLPLDGPGRHAEAARPNSRAGGRGGTVPGHRACDPGKWLAEGLARHLRALRAQHRGPSTRSRIGSATRRSCSTHPSPAWKNSVSSNAARLMSRRWCSGRSRWAPRRPRISARRRRPP